MYFNYETIPVPFSNVLRAFNTQNDKLGGFQEGLTGLAAFQDTYYHGPPRRAIKRGS